ncbi:hypothetical protein QUB70_23555 [Microcoleus sp. A003_D6]
MPIPQEKKLFVGWASCPSQLFLQEVYCNNCQLPTVNCQQSTVNCQLPTVNCQFKAIRSSVAGPDP